MLVPRLRGRRLLLRLPGFCAGERARSGRGVRMRRGVPLRAIDAARVRVRRSVLIATRLFVASRHRAFGGGFAARFTLHLVETLLPVTEPLTDTNVLYAADTANGKIDVITDNFSTMFLTSDFVDRNLPAGYTPFNIQNLRGALNVTYRGAAGGFVDATRKTTRSSVASAATAQAGRSTHRRGSARRRRRGDRRGGPVGLRVGNGGAGGAADMLYFTAGSARRPRFRRGLAPKVA